MENNREEKYIWESDLTEVVGREWDNEEIRRIVAQYRRMSDAELLAFIRAAEAKLGRYPTKADIPVCGYFKSRFGPWNRVLEAAGVKPVSELYLQRQENKKQRKANKHKEYKRRQRMKKEQNNGNEKKKEHI